ncbi:hypothetical protein KSP39_PZI019462 [Platanthera zijinensis]|uniref:DUF7733 domain-containing protein n=1 Tax=Platanthera zijinensis TaxID=2320716 RepID=A0AAP0FYG9_9ASPA
MSGLSLAVAPRSDPHKESLPPAKNQPVMGGMMGSLRVIELQLVAFIIVFSVSGLVPVVDLLFPAFATIYALILSRIVFPSPKHPGRLREVFHASFLFRAYVMLGTVLGLFLPLAYVLGGFARGDDQAVRSATPHLFLLSCQILSENVISGLSIFSPPVRAIISLLYTARRIFVIVDWNYDVWMNKAVSDVAPIKDVAWFWFGRGLSMANLVYFSVNLFGFLIPRFLPRSFERYFKEREETRAMMTEDKPAAGGTTAVRNSDETKKTE